MLYVPPLEELQVPSGSREARIEHAVNWFMAFILTHGRTWLALLSAEDGLDPEVRQIMNEADDLAASRVLEALEFSGTAKQRRVAMTAIRSFGSMSKAMGRELVLRESITRADAKRVLVAALTATLDSVGV